MKAGLDPIKFGTSGWRARIADTYTFANVRRLTRAIADHLRDAGEAERGTVVGYDTRFLSEDFAAAAAGTLAQAGIRCRLAVAAVPTPTVAHAPRRSGRLAWRLGHGRRLISLEHGERKLELVRVDVLGTATKDVSAELIEPVAKLLDLGVLTFDRRDERLDLRFLCGSELREPLLEKRVFGLDLEQHRVETHTLV